LPEVIIVLSLSRLDTGSKKGFTLLEVIIVLSVLAMFAAMAVPLAGRLEARGRVRETERRLELVREAMLGARGTAFLGGRRTLAGYAGDLGGLPPLRRSVWNDALQIWEWPEEAAASVYESYWRSGMGQPRNLWAPLPGSVRWRGPYLHEPRDELPGNAEHLRWTFGERLTDAQATANREIEMRQTAGRLADAWGRSLLFFYVQTGLVGTETFHGEATVQTTVYIVSEGPDLHSSWPAYRLDTRENEDNLVLTITPQEWRDEARAEETGRLLQAAADALVGRWGPADRLGRPVFGGFVGDHGRWPELFVWQGGTAPWVTAAVYETVYIGQPRGLWTRDTNGDGILAEPLAAPPDLRLPPDPGAAGTENVLLGFGWRGPYLPRPEGKGEADVLRDAWGVPLEFRLSHAGDPNPPATQTLKITSAGQDGMQGTTDDLREVVSRHFDVRQRITLEGTVVNETDKNRQLVVRLHAYPAVNLPTVDQLVYGRTTVEGQVYGNAWFFRLEAERTSAGPRLLELAEWEWDGTTWQFRRRDWTTVHIGSGGTATPEREPLILRAR
jgi:prepilin-type N-terminal cleavage/methylation domain-containing protein